MFQSDFKPKQKKTKKRVSSQKQTFMKHAIDAFFIVLNMIIKLYFMIESCILVFKMKLIVPCDDIGGYTTPLHNIYFNERIFKMRHKSSQYRSNFSILVSIVLLCKFSLLCSCVHK